MDAFEDFAKKWPWFHAFDLGDVRTRGRFPHEQLQNRTLLAVFEALNRTQVQGCDCLDIGAVDGLTSFGLKQLGARSVVATDRVETESFLRLRDRLRLDIEYHPGVEIATMLERFQGRRFDIVVCAGVIYHMLNPFSAFEVCRKLTKPGGICFMESATRYADQAVLYVNSETATIDEPHTYFVPTPSAMAGMMRMACFDVLDECSTPSADRHLTVGRAVARTEVLCATPLLASMLRRGYTDFAFDIENLDNGASRNEILYAAGPAHELTEETERAVQFPFHPVGPNAQAIVPVLGQRHWQSGVDEESEGDYVLEG